MGRLATTDILERRAVRISTGVHDSPLGRWQFAEAQLPSWGSLVEGIWYFDGMAAARREQALPNGRLQLIVQFDHRYHDVHGETTVLCPQICMTGLQTGPLVVQAPECRSAVMGIRLHPVGAYRLLGRSLAETSGLTVDLQDVIGRAAAELGDYCADARSPEERVRRAAEWVSMRMEAHPAVDATVAWMADRIEESGGRRRIEDLREATGLTKRRLLDAFRAQIGVTPKLYARIVRLRETLGRLHTTRTPLSEIALAAGYYDQPHMNADFRELCGLAPTEFLAASRYSATSMVY